MWTFRETVRIEEAFSQWYAVVTLENNGVPESFFLRFPTQPTTAIADAEGQKLALRFNTSEAIVITDSVSREEFFGKFTNAEIAAIYKAAQTNDDLFAYVKKLEINPTVNKNNADVIAGLQLLEQVGLLAAGRANEILE